jgi:hypothetical protein
MFSIYGRTNTKGKSLKKLTALFADDFFCKKRSPHPKAQRPNSERNLYSPPRKLSPQPSHNARGVICTPANLSPEGRIAKSGNDIKNHRAVIAEINISKPTSPTLPA